MPSYIVVVSPSYGGAEKRFFDIFRSLRAQGADVRMIAPSLLIDHLLVDLDNPPELASAMLSIALSTWSRSAFILGFRRLLSTLQRGSNFHYPMNCLWPLHLGRGDRVSMSVTDCTEVPGPSADNYTKFWTWLSFFFVERVDVLNPAILAEMSSYRMARKMSLTPGGTFLCSPMINHQKRRPTVVMLSRLVKDKGIIEFLDVLPTVWDAMQNRVSVDFTFEIAGYGPLQDLVIERVMDLAKSGVPISFIGYADATALFSRSAVTLSMQKITNYPSRVVAEALTSGCAAIVRNTGDSMQFGRDIPGLVYCHAVLNPLELANQLVELVTRNTADERFSSHISAAAVESFSADACIAYFREILTHASEPAISNN